MTEEKETMTEEQIINAVKSDSTLAKTWLQKHERIALTIILSGATLFGTNKYLGVVADHDKLQATIATQTLAVQQSKDVALAAQAQQDAKQYQVTVAALTQQNAQLAAASANRTIVLQQQQATDKTLPMPDLGNRWASLIAAQPGDLVATVAGITVSPTAALTTTLQLEQIPVLTKNLADAQTQNTNSQAELSQANVVIGSQSSEITGLHTEITDQKTADAKELTAVKAQARKGKLRSFLYGVGVGIGITVAEVIHHAL